MTRRIPAGTGDRTYREVAAYHEAGHAVAGLLLGIEVVLAYVDRVRPGSGATGYRTTQPLWEKRSLPHSTAPSRWALSLSPAQRAAVFCLAGPVAEARFLGTPLRSLDATGDFKDVLELVQDPIVRHHGEIRRYGNQFFATAARRTRALLSRRPVWNAVTEVARELLAWERLTGEEMAATLEWARSGGRQFGLFTATSIS